MEPPTLRRGRRRSAHRARGHCTPWSSSPGDG